MRSAAEYIWSRKARASRSKRALRCAEDSCAAPCGVSRESSSGRGCSPVVPLSVPVTGPTSSDSGARPESASPDSENIPDANGTLDGPADPPPADHHSGQDRETVELLGHGRGEQGERVVLGEVGGVRYGEAVVAVRDLGDAGGLRELLRPPEGVAPALDDEGRQPGVEQLVGAGLLERTG